MFRRLFSRSLGAQREVFSGAFLPTSTPDDGSPLLDGALYLPQRWKKGPGKRSKYALRKKEEIEDYRRSPFGLEGKRVKHFDELKFYHAKNKYGQNQTLVDSRRRDIAFFDPVKGGYERDPRSTYEPSDSDADFDDEEAKLFADFTDTDDEDIYFGGGNDADGDYDDDGNELRPRPKKGEKTWADEDPPIAVENDETDPDEDAREFNEVFGDSPGRKERRDTRFEISSSDDEFSLKNDSANVRGDDEQPIRSRASQKGNSQTKATITNEGEIDFSKPDPELGINLQAFKSRFDQKNENGSPIEKKDFSAEKFMNEGESMSETDTESEWDEERMIRAGDEEMEEMMDISAMVRDYDRRKTRPVTQRMVDDETEREMDSGELYESDDPQLPYSEDPRVDDEMNAEEEANIRRLKSTPGGRKLWKRIDKEFGYYNELPPRGKKIYEDALRGPEERARRRESRGRSRREDDRLVHFANRDDDISVMAKSKTSDSFRTLSTNLETVDELSTHVSDLRKSVHSIVMRDKTFGMDRRERRREQAEHNEEDNMETRRTRGRPPYGGDGVRFYSTQRRIEPREQLPTEK